MKQNLAKLIMLLATLTAVATQTACVEDGEPDPEVPSQPAEQSETTEPPQITSNSDDSADSEDPRDAPPLVNESPQAANDFYQIEEDSSLLIGAPGVLGNDSDPDGDSLKAAQISGSNNVHIGEDGSIQYTPPKDHFGTLSVNYQACDPGGACHTATLTINVLPINDAPIPQPDAFWTYEGVTLDIHASTVLANDGDPDGDPLFIPEEAQGQGVTENGGTFQISDDLLGEVQFYYTPAEDFTGIDNFSYLVCDRPSDPGNNDRLCALSNLTIDVRPRSLTGWNGIPDPTRECQAWHGSGTDNIFITNPYADGMNLDGWEAYDGDGNVYNIDNPVPSGTYIGDLTYTCKYSAPYSDGLWTSVVSHYSQQWDNIQGYLDELVDGATDPNTGEPLPPSVNFPNAWFMAWINYNPFNPGPDPGERYGVHDGWSVFVNVRDYPWTRVGVLAPHGVLIESVDDPNYPAMTSEENGAAPAERNAIHVTVTDGGKQRLRDQMAVGDPMLSWGTQPEEWRPLIEGSLEIE